MTWYRITIEQSDNDNNNWGDIYMQSFEHVDVETVITTLNVAQAQWRQDLNPQAGATTQKLTLDPLEDPSYNLAKGKIIVTDNKGKKL